MSKLALKQLKNWISCLLVSLICLSILGLTPIQASYAKSRTKVVQLSPNFGKPLRLPEKASTLAIGDPNIADIVTVEPDLLMITGQSNGSTSLTVIGKSGNIYQYTLLVANDVTQLRALVHTVAPNVSVDSIKNRILLKGTVETAAQLTRVLTLADRYMGGKGSKPSFQVISDQGGVLAGKLDENNGQFVSEANVNVNNVAAGGGGRGGTQGNAGGGRRGGIGQGGGAGNGKANLAQNISRASVLSVADGRIISMIKVLNQPKVEIQMRIVEVDRAKTDEFGIDWRLDGNNVTIGSFAGDVTGSLPSPNSNNAVTSGAANLIGFFQPGKYTLSTFVRALEEKGATSTLSEPLLTALSGEASQFLVGGSVPIPTQEATTSQLGATAVSTNVEFINFGLGITVRPTVLENGKINIVLNQSMSSLDYGSAIQILGTQVPGFKQKTISTVTESESGETWAVAGLLTEEDRKRLQSVPWISKVPILGNIFKNKNDSVSRNEMIILVNARRVDTPNSTTTSFKNKGMLRSETYEHESIEENEIDSHLPYIPAKTSNQKNQPAVQNKQPIKHESNTSKNQPSTDDTDLPVYETFKGKRMNHALSNDTRPIDELNSDINLDEHVAVIYLKQRNTNQQVLIASTTKTDETVVNFDSVKEIEEQPTKLFHLEPDIESNDQQADFIANTIEEAEILKEDLFERLEQNRLAEEKAFYEDTHSYDISEDELSIAQISNQLTENVRGIKITSAEPVKAIGQEEIILHNFLIGKEKLAYLSSAQSHIGDISIEDAMKTWKVATGSRVNNPDQQVTFLIKNNPKNRLYSGAKLAVQPTLSKQHMVAVDYEYSN